MERLTQREKMLTQHEETLAAEARAELVSHYAELSREVELRQARAEWRVKRMNLQEKRLEFLHSEQVLSQQEWTAIPLTEHRKEDTPPLHPSSSPSPVHDPILIETVNAPPHKTQAASVMESSPPNSNSPDPLSLTYTSHDHPSPSRTSQEFNERESEERTSSLDIDPFTTSETVEQVVLEPSSNILSHEGEVSDVATHTLELVNHEHQDTTGSSSQSQPSTTRHIIYPKERSLQINEQGYPRLFSTRGHAPRSSVEQIIYGSVEANQCPIVSSRGRAPTSTIQRLLYPVEPDMTLPDKRQEGSDQPLQMMDQFQFGPSSKFPDDFAHLGK